MGLKSHVKRRASALALAMPIVALAARGAAQPADPKARAQQLFQEGRRAVSERDCARAVPLFAESLALHPTRGTLFNLAQCEEQTGKWASALERFSRLLQDLPPGDPRHGLAQKSVAALEQRVPRLQIELRPGAPPPARVTLDGADVPVARLAEGLRVDPGEHELVLAWPEGEAQAIRVAAAEGMRERLHVEPPAKPVAPPLEKAPAPPRAPALLPPDAPATGPWRAAGFISIGVGVVSLGASATTGLMMLSRKSELAELCPVPSQCSPEGLQVASEGQTLKAVSVVTLLAGLAAVGAGGALVLVSPDQPAAAAIAPVALHAGGGVVLRTRF